MTFLRFFFHFESKRKPFPEIPTVGLKTKRQVILHYLDTPPHLQALLDNRQSVIISNKFLEFALGAFIFDKNKIIKNNNLTIIGTVISQNLHSLKIIKLLLEWLRYYLPYGSFFDDFIKK